MKDGNREARIAAMMQSRSNRPQLHPLNDAAWENFATTGKSDRAAFSELAILTTGRGADVCAPIEGSSNKHSTNLSTL